MPNLNNVTIVKIAITGGPCSGKSTAKSWIGDEFGKHGWKVYFVSEAATDAAAGNASPHEFSDPVKGQVAMYFKQIADEKFYEDIAKLNSKSGDKILIVCDRGSVDALAFLDADQQRAFKNIIGKNRRSMMEQYDAAFHLVSAAIGAPEYYTLANNSARKETIEEAAIIDHRTVEAWTGHPHLRIIDNSTDFHGKMMRLLNEIAAFTGEPSPYEIERKFLIKRPDVDALDAMTSDCSEIIQTYLDSENGGERRIRQRGSDGVWSFTMTEKKDTDSSLARVEVERRITDNEYLNLLMEADTRFHQIRKTRWCVPYASLYYEIDLYPFSSEYAIMEVELPDETTDVAPPPFVEVIREVTDDPSYRNKNLALTQRL